MVHKSGRGEIQGTRHMPFHQTPLSNAKDWLKEETESLEQRQHTKRTR